MGFIKVFGFMENKCKKEVVSMEDFNDLEKVTRGLSTTIAELNISHNNKIEELNGKIESLKETIEKQNIKDSETIEQLKDRIKALETKVGTGGLGG